MAAASGPVFASRAVRRFVLVAALGAAGLAGVAWYSRPLAARTRQALRARTLSPTLKYILVWKSYFDFPNLGYGESDGQAVFVTAQCPESHCYMTTDRSLMPEDQWDAVVVHTYQFSLSSFSPFNQGKLPSSRSPSQRYVFFLMESPAYCGSSYEGLEYVFNWTMTYRADSDIPRPYGRVRPRNASQPEGRWLQPPKPPPSTPPPTLLATLDASNASTDASTDAEGPLVAWLVSDCNSVSLRQEYVKRLSMYVKVHIYGKCGRHWPKGVRALNSFFAMLPAMYQFYVSFENSLCKDYVTEKLFNALHVDGVIPIVFGGANYSGVAPPRSYIDALSFPSARALASYLHWLHRHPEEFNKFFWWKEHYEVVSVPRRPLCRLCEMLHAPLPRKTYADIGSWWHDGTCTEPDPSHW